MDVYVCELESEIFLKIQSFFRSIWNTLILLLIWAPVKSNKLYVPTATEGMPTAQIGS